MIPIPQSFSRILVKKSKASRGREKLPIKLPVLQYCSCKLLKFSSLLLLFLHHRHRKLCFWTADSQWWHAMVVGLKLFRQDWFEDQIKQEEARIPAFLQIIGFHHNVTGPEMIYSQRTIWFVAFVEKHNTISCLFPPPFE